MICSTNVLFITDEDAVFKGEKFQSFLIETNSNIQFLTPYTTHNALLVESVTIRTIKARLRRINQDFSKFNWVKYLPTITFQSNIMPSKSLLHYSAYEIFYGRKYNVAGYIGLTKFKAQHTSTPVIIDYQHFRKKRLDQKYSVYASKNQIVGKKCITKFSKSFNYGRTFRILEYNKERSTVLIEEIGNNKNRLRRHLHEIRLF